jgi:type II secretory pathway pseudopilin PulG
MKKIKSFGLIESIAASTIMVVVVSGALALASSSVRTASSDQAFLEAENIAEFVFEKVQEKKSQGEAYFVKPNPAPANSFSIECFDTTVAYSNLNCFKSIDRSTKTGLDYVQTDIEQSGGKHSVEFNGLANPAFGAGFFKYSISVDKPTYFEDSIVFPKDKIVSVNVEVTWNDVGGEKKYYARQYFGDWER